LSTTDIADIEWPWKKLVRL